MEKRISWKFPYDRPLTANTLCVVGVCTCLMMKMAVERAFGEIGITDYDVEPSTEDNPIGSRSETPDVIFCEPLRSSEISQRVPGALVIEITDLADQDKIRDDIVSRFAEAGWLEGDENDG